MAGGYHVVLIPYCLYALGSGTERAPCVRMGLLPYLAACETSLQNTFDAIDLDGSGSIDCDELMHAFR